MIASRHFLIEVPNLCKALNDFARQGFALQEWLHIPANDGPGLVAVCIAGEVEVAPPQQATNDSSEKTIAANSGLDPEVSGNSLPSPELVVTV